jgi:hypothetical protein
MLDVALKYNKIPLFYSYIIGFEARAALDLKDCDFETEFTTDSPGKHGSKEKGKGKGSKGKGKGKGSKGKGSKGKSKEKYDKYKTLCHMGAKFIKENRSFLLGRYHHQASAIRDKIGQNKKAIFLIEPNFWYLS